MSSYVVSDHTILAIVEGMRRYGLIAKKKAESRDMAESLKLINEYQTTKRYMKPGAMKQWAIEQDHRPVTASPRKYTDGETLAATQCYLYQIEAAPLHDFDFITLVSAVKILRQKIIEAGEASGTLRAIERDGGTCYQEKDESGDFIDIYDLYEWDLAA